MPHSYTKIPPIITWDPYCKLPELFFPFGAAGTVVDTKASKTKLQSRSRPALFMHNYDGWTPSGSDSVYICRSRLFDFTVRSDAACIHLQTLRELFVAASSKSL